MKHHHRKAHDGNEDPVIIQEKLFNQKLNEANDPQALQDLLIQELKREIKILEVQAMQLKSKLGILHKDPVRKLEECKSKIFVEKHNHFNDIHKIHEVDIEFNPSEIAKYPTHMIPPKKYEVDQAIPHLIVHEDTFGSAAAKHEYIVELQSLVADYKKQIQILKTKVQHVQQPLHPTHKQAKHEGFDQIHDGQNVTFLPGKSQIYESKLQQKKEKEQAQQRNKQLQNPIDPDDVTLNDRLIENLLLENDLLQQEIFRASHIKDVENGPKYNQKYIQQSQQELDQIAFTPPVAKGGQIAQKIQKKDQKLKSKEKPASQKSLRKIEGQDFKSVNEIHAKAGLKYLQQKKSMEAHKKAVEEEYIKGLIAEHMLLDMKLARMQNEK